MKEQQGGTLTNAIKWNFSAFVVDKEGNVVKRFGPMSNTSALEEEIKARL